jgi:hypothetical protein
MLVVTHALNNARGAATSHRPYWKAPSPVIACPTIRECMSWVPS